MSASRTPYVGIKVRASRSSSHKQGLRRFAPLSVRHHAGGWKVKIHWNSFVLQMGIVCLLGWFGTASAMYFFIKYNRGFTDVRFTHMLFLPARWHAYEADRGNFLIKTAQQDLKNEKFREAFDDLRLGLIKSPANKEGRLLLAQLYMLSNRPDLGRSTLLGGFAYHKNDSDYLKAIFSFLLEKQEDKVVMDLYWELRTGDPSVIDRNLFIALAAASACYFRGNYDEAESILRLHQIANTRDGRLLITRINWDNGAKDLALEQIRKLASELPNDEEIYAFALTYFREAGLNDDARRESFFRVLSNPMNARARIDMLYAYQKAGDTASLQRSVDELYRDFKDDSNALLGLAEFAASTGDAALAHIIYDHTNTQTQNWEGPALMAVEACIVAKQYQAGLELTRSLLKENPEWGKRSASVFNGLQAVANYGLGDAEAADLFLSNFLKQGNVRGDSLIAVSNRLLNVGAKSQARQVLDQAVQSDGLNQAALNGLIQLDVELNNTAPLASNVRKLLSLRKPSQTVLRTAYNKLGSDLFLFTPERTTILSDVRAVLVATPPTP